MQRLLPYLPDGSAEAAESLIAINRDLDAILLLDLPALWAAVRSDTSIVTFLDSYLRNALRPFDDGFQELSDIEHAVWQHATALFVKLLGARGGGIPLHADRSSLLSRLLTVPCMLDACSLFSASFTQQADKNTPNQLTTALAGMVSLKPTLQSEFPSTAVTIAENLLEVVEACVSAAPAARKDPEMLNSLIDGVSYAKDACLSLCALINTYPQAAGLFLSTKDPSHTQQLIETLGAVHDQLLPIVENIAFSGIVRGKESPVHSNLARICLQVEVASEVAVAELLTYAYLDASVEDITGGSSSSSAGGSSGGSRSLHSTTNPAAIQRGEALLHAFTLLGQREDGVSGGSGGDGSSLSLGPALAQRHGIGGTIQKAVHAGVVVLDEAQTDYIAALLGVSSLAAAPVVVVNDGANGNTTNTNANSGGGATGNSAGMNIDNSSTGGGTVDESAVLLSLVSQVKDLLPEYGDGYIATCLDALDRNPERVINALLEGNLPREVVESDVDSQLTFEKYMQINKEKVVTEAAFPVLPGMTTTATTTADASQKKRNNDSLTAKYLDTKEATYAEKIKAAAIQSQWEYEDEYDDSYDELLHIGANGVAEGEGGGEEEEEEGGKLVGAGAAAAAAAALRGLSLGGRDSSSGPNSNRGGGRGGGRGPRGKGGKLWVLDGRVYNYPKPGAKEVASEADAQAAIQQAEQAAKEIHGLGPGGNKPGSNRRFPNSAASGTGAAAPPSTQQGGGEQEGEKAEQSPTGSGGGRGGGRGGSGGRGGGSSGGSHKYKDKNKAAIGNHHRKDRAAQKMSRGM